MYTYTRKLSVKLCSLLLVLSFLATGAVAQTVDCPVGYICLTQEEANVARNNAVELREIRGKVTTLEESLKIERQNVKDAQDTARKNEADLTKVLHKTEVELARTTGELIGIKAENTSLKTMVEFLNKNGRKKCNWLSVCL